MKNTVLLILVVTLCYALSVEADWKFWKKSTTTTTPSTLSLSSSTTTTTTTTPNAALPLSPTNPSQLTSGPNVQQQPVVTNTNRGPPQRPNPGTDVGQDFPLTKPPARGGNVGNLNNNGYRDWAIDITGAGEPGKNPPPQRPNSQGPPRPNESTQQRPPGQVPSTQKPSTPSTITSTTIKPVASISNFNQNQNGFVNQPTRSPELHKSSTTTAKPSGQINYPALPIRPGTNQQSAQPVPTRGPSYADIASRPGSPTQTQRPAFVEPTSARPQGGNIPAAGQKTYTSNPTYSKGNTVTDEDLEKLSEALFIKDTNNVNKHITLNLQKKTTSSATNDEAQQPLLQVNSQALQGPTVQRVLSIYDNYNLDTKIHEHISPQQREEESLLVDTFLSTNVMSAAMRFLSDKAFVKKDYYEYKDLLRRIWFNLFSRGEGKIGSSGFEHVFMSEIKGSEVIGLHNWIYFNSEETKNKINYLGYLKKVDLGDKASILKVHVKMNDIIKPTTTLFVGTSPELEMALYTVCFLTRPEAPCPVSLGGTKFNIVTHKFKYRGKDLVGTAYPDI